MEIWKDATFNSSDLDEMLDLKSLKRNLIVFYIINLAKSRKLITTKEQHKNNIKKTKNWPFR